MKPIRYKSALSLFLCFILLFTGEVPAYAQGAAGIKERLEQTRLEKEEETLRLEREAAIFAVQEGITLSSNFPGMEETFTETGETGQDAPEKNPWEEETGPSGWQDKTPLRQPETDTPVEDPSWELLETGEHHKTYRLPDGTYKTLFTAAPNTYEENGEEKPIDNTLISGNGAEEGTYTNKANDIDITFHGPEDRNALSVTAEGMEAVLVPTEGNYALTAVSENAIRYNEVFENIDIQYTAGADGVKQDIILLAPQEKTDFTYRLPKENILAVLENNTVFLYKKEGDTISGNTVSGNTTMPWDENTEAGNTLNGNTPGAGAPGTDAVPVMTISAPGMEDAAGAFSPDITLELAETQDAWLITLHADKSWLSDPERAYPVKIDPSTIVLKNQIHNYTIASQAGAMPNQPCSHAGYFDGIGKARSYVIADFLYESILFGQKDVEILSATLNIYQVNNATGFMVGCYRLADDLPHWGQAWDNTITIDRHIAGEDAIKPAGEGWHHFDVRESVNGWMRGTGSHGLVLISASENAAGAMFASDSYPDPALTPTLEIVWQPAGDIPFNYPLDDTTINLRPMVQTTVSGKMQCYGVFADGTATPGAYVAYTLSDASKNYAGAMITGNTKLYPDSSPFQSLFPAGTLGYKDSLSNWQTAAPFTWYELNTAYTINARSATAEKLGKTATSDPFLIYRVTRYDTMQKIADYYGVPLNTLLSDNKAADMLLVENNTLFIRNPTRNKNTPYQPADLTDEEKAAIDTALLGRALHCEYGFEPVNLNTGNFYLAQEDFSYGDILGTFALQRSYNSLNSSRLGSFGRGFTSFLDESVSALSDGTLVYNREDGSSIPFTPDGKGGYKAPEGYRLQLKREAAGTASAEFSAGVQNYTLYRYTLTLEDNSQRTFDAGGNLIQVRGEKGDTLTIQRNAAGQLTGITREGKTMPVTTTPEGMIASITMPNGGVFRYAYDSRQNLSTVTDPMGGTKRFAYDNLHRMTAWYDENNTRVVQNTYDSRGRVTKQVNETGGVITLEYTDGKTAATDARGNTTIYEYDSGYRTTAIRYPDGTSVEREYRDGQMIKETDRAGVETTFTYDGSGNITGKTTGDAVSAYAYDKAGRLVEYTDPLGNTTRSEYDKAGNLTKLTDPEGHTTAFAYDAGNRLIGKTDAGGNAIIYTYNGNCLSEIRINGHTTDSFTHNALGQTLSHTDGEGNTTTYTYDAMGRNTAVTDPEGNTTATSYEKNGLIKSVTDAEGGTTAYTYDKADNITSITDPLGNRFEFAYDAGGNRILKTDPEGNTTGYTYDEMDRLVKTTDALGGTYLYAYDAHDNPISATDPLGNRQEMTYDPVYGQPLTHVDEEGTETAYAYDPCGNLLSITKAGIPVAAYAYNGNGQCTMVTLADGPAWHMEYDGNGNCTLKTDKNGRTLTFTYDEENRLIKETTASGGEYAYAYDRAGNLTEKTYPDAGTDTFTHDKNGNTLTWTDGEGNTTAYAYDRTGNLTKETLPDGTKHRYAYDPSGRLSLSADARGYVTAYEYDKTGNLTAVTDPLGQKTTWKWDGLGRNTETTDAMGRTTVYTYDADGNLLTENAPDGSVNAYAYDKTGRPVKVTDPLSNSTLYQYDPFGRLTKETDAAGGNTRYTYDLMGNLTSVTDGLGHKTTYEYDPYGNPVSETDADGNRTEYTYDPEDRLTEIRDAAGNRTELAYDNTGNLLTVKDPSGAVYAYTYDKTGNLLTETAPDGGVITHAYDRTGNLIRTTDSLLRTTGYTYDPSGNLTGVTEPSGAAVSYGYDPLDRLTSVTHEDGTKDLYAYDPAGNLIHTKEGEQRLTAYTYDSMDRLTAVEDAMGNKTAYAYDLCGNLISETAPDATETAYAYDALNRLREVTLADGGTYRYAYDKAGRLTKASNPAGMETAYEYDPVGNLTLLTKGTGQKTSYRYDALNRLTETEDALGGRTRYAYDRTGNLTGITYADGTTAGYEYDKTGRITGTTDQAGLHTTFRYDTEGQLLSETAGAGREDARTHTYTYDKNGNLTGITDPLEQTTTYSYDIRNRLTGTTTPGGRTTAYEYDALSSLKAVTDAAGARTTYTYDAKGRITGEDLAGEEYYAYTYDACDRLVAVQGENSLVTYTYNAAGDLNAATNGNGETTLYAYDQAGNLTETTDPLGNTAANAYDRAGKLISHTDENGTTTTYTYDALERLTKKDTGETLSTAAYEYDALGRPTRMEDVTGESAYTYDETGRLFTAADGNGRKLTYTYDIYGNITAITYPDGGKTTYTYDALDRMTSVTTPEGKTTRYEYDKDGNMTKAIRENGETTILYDSLGQVKALANTENGALISAYAYAYDKRGNITREETRILKEGKLEESISLYTYDGKSQLIRAEQTTDGEGTAITEYTYDPAGNRLEMQTRKGKDTLTVTYTYDKGGRLVKKEDSQSGTSVYEYDRAGNLVLEKRENTAGEGNTTEFPTAATDPAGSAGTEETILSLTERHYLYDASGRLSAVTDKDTLLLAALYDGNGNRTFAMEYMPELKNTGSGTGKTEKEGNGRNGSAGRDTDIREGQLSGNAMGEPVAEDPAGNTGDKTTRTGNEPDKGMKGTGAFWYGVLCQLADILLPSPTPFKAWLHEKMGSADDISVLWTEEIHETDLREETLSVQEAGSPSALVESIFAGTNGKPLETDAYRQVNYVNVFMIQ